MAHSDRQGLSVQWKKLGKYGFLLMNFIRSAVEGGCDSLLVLLTLVFSLLLQ